MTRAGHHAVTDDTLVINDYPENFWRHRPHAMKAGDRCTAEAGALIEITDNNAQPQGRHALAWTRISLSGVNFENPAGAGSFTVTWGKVDKAANDRRHVGRDGDQRRHGDGDQRAERDCEHVYDGDAGARSKTTSRRFAGRL